MSRTESASLVTREDQPDAGLSLHDAVVFIQRNRHIFLSSAVVGCILGLAIAFVVPAEWEASALVRVGQLGSTVTSATSATSVTNIEPPLHAVGRIKSKSFQDGVLKSLGLPIDDDNAKNFHEELKVKLEKSELISLSLRNTSANKAQLQLNAVIDQLELIHTKISAPITSSWHQELASIDAELKQANIESERLTKSLELQSGSLNVKGLILPMAVSNLLLARSGELASLRNRKISLEFALNPKNTFDTTSLGSVDISEKPVFPKKSLFAIGGLVIGLLLGILWSMLGVAVSKRAA